MNRVKFRPVGKSGPIVEVKVTQKKRAIENRLSPMPSVANANRNMDRKGFVRAGSRYV